MSTEDAEDLDWFDQDIDTIVDSIKHSKIAEETKKTLKQEALKKKKVDPPEKENLNHKRERQPSSGESSVYVQPMSYKKLTEICEMDDYQLILETFLNIESFVETLILDQLPKESIIKVIEVASRILQLPYTSHNQYLTTELSKVTTFWDQVLKFIIFLEDQADDIQIKLFLDIGAFWRNLDILLSNIFVQVDEIPESMRNFMASLEGIVNDHPDSKNRNIAQKLIESTSNIEQNKTVHRIYEVSLRKFNEKTVEFYKII
jgi:hypothetical protein